MPVTWKVAVDGMVGWVVDEMKHILHRFTHACRRNEAGHFVRFAWCLRSGSL